MTTIGDIEQGDAREEAGRCTALWVAVLGQVVADGDLDYVSTASFRYVCAIAGLDDAWTAKKLRAAIADRAPKLWPGARKEQGEHHRPRAKRTHSEATRAKLRAAWARRRVEAPGHRHRFTFALTPELGAPL
jgi:hypothetical protein